MQSNLLPGFVNLVGKSVLLVGGAVPVVGEFFDLVQDLCNQGAELIERVDQAKEFVEWSKKNMKSLEEIKKQFMRRADAGNNEPIAEALCQACTSLTESIKLLRAVASRICASNGKAKTYFRGMIYKNDFESAKQAYEDAKKAFQDALALDTHEKVHRNGNSLQELHRKADLIRTEVSTMSVKVLTDQEDFVMKKLIEQQMTEEAEAPSRSRSGSWSQCWPRSHSPRSGLSLSPEEGVEEEKTEGCVEEEAPSRPRSRSWSQCWPRSPSPRRGRSLSPEEGVEEEKTEGGAEEEAPFRSRSRSRSRSPPPTSSPLKSHMSPR